MSSRSPSDRQILIARHAGVAIATVGLLLVLLSPAIGPAISDALWEIEPVAYIGAVVLFVGLAVAVAAFFARERTSAKSSGAKRWSQVTQDYFDTFSHDMGRPFRRILGKERDVRARLEESGEKAPQVVHELLDEIEQQAPSFRLMLANVRVLVEIEDPASAARVEPVDPAAIVRNVADRYMRIASERGADLSWWCEPTEFGLVYGDPAALDHIVTNLVDNAVKFASRHIEVRLTRNPEQYVIRVWDDGPGIQQTHRPHLFDRGWTPEVAGRQEKTSSGLGLYIARSLVRRADGEIVVESSTDAAADREKEQDHFTAMTVMLPLSAPARST